MKKIDKLVLGFFLEKFWAIYLCEGFCLKWYFFVFRFSWFFVLRVCRFFEEGMFIFFYRVY